MRYSLLAVAIATATVGVSAAARATEENEPSPRATEQAEPLAGYKALGPDRGPDERPLPPRMRTMPGPDALSLATKLSAAEIYLGVTPEQLGFWRTYTTALIDLVPPGPVRNPPSPDESRGKGDARPEPRLAGEELAAIIVQKAEKAKILQNAIAQLKPKLSPQQVLKLAELERALILPLPPAPRHGPAERGGFASPYGDMKPPGPEAAGG